MASVSIYIFRHGETDWNAERRFQGHTDIPLNEKGREQAKQLGEVLKTLQLEVILSSDLSRAHDTAKIAAAGLNIPIEITKHLREAYLGDPEGKLRDEIIRFYGEEQWQKWLSGRPEDLDFSFPRGETKREHLARVLNSLTDFLNRNPRHKKIGVSSHGGTLKRFLHFCEGAPAESIPTPNCCIYKVEHLALENRWIYQGAVASIAQSEKLFT
jgi:broad specificity phosphatase PhoE